jgi:hypothetical protein
MKKILIFLLLFSAVLLVAAVLLVEKNQLAVENYPLIKKMPVLEERGGSTVPGEAKGVSSGNENCDLSAYGMECGITKYLEENLAWTTSGGVDFCSYERFLSEKSSGKMFMDVVCEEFFKSGEKIYIGSGVQVPVMISTANGSMELWIPRDGDYFAGDVRAAFPQDVGDLALNYGGYGRLHMINVERAENYFGAPIDYKVEKVLETDCSSALDCVTPGEYLAQSRCQFTSRCLQGKCAVICPNYHLIQSINNQ